MSNYLTSRLALVEPIADRRDVGLTISRQLMEIMGGNLDFHSIVDEGSTFWIEFPPAEPKP